MQILGGLKIKEPGLGKIVYLVMLLEKVGKRGKRKKV